MSQSNLYEELCKEEKRLTEMITQIKHLKSLYYVDISPIKDLKQAELPLLNIHLDLPKKESASLFLYNRIKESNNRGTSPTTADLISSYCLAKGVDEKIGRGTVYTQLSILKKDMYIYSTPNPDGAGSIHDINPNKSFE